MDHYESERMKVLSKFCLDDKVAIVTGAGSGIGANIALSFATVGAYLVVVDLLVSRAEATAEKISAVGRRAFSMAIDVSDADQVQIMVEKSIKEFGKIDILVNNVGGAPRTAPMLDITEEIWDATFDQSLKTTFLCTKYVGKVMIGQKGGNIINIGSGLADQPSPLFPAYSAAKAGVANFTRTAAVVLAPYNIRVNCIQPGPITTTGGSKFGSPKERAEWGDVPLGRSGNTEDVALAAVYFASDAADFVTGIVMDVRGGPHLGRLILERSEEMLKRLTQL